MCAQSRSECEHSAKIHTLEEAYLHALRGYFARGIIEACRQPAVSLTADCTRGDNSNINNKIKAFTPKSGRLIFMLRRMPNERSSNQRST